jgi:hypothetical protein
MIPDLAVESSRAMVYNCTFFKPERVFMELNPLYTRIDDLQGRVAALRGYL